MSSNGNTDVYIAVVFPVLLNILFLCIVCSKRYKEEKKDTDLPVVIVTMGDSDTSKRNENC